MHALMAYQGLPLQEAMDQVINGILADMNAGGGAIGLDNEGNIAAVFNTEGMYRAWIDKGGDMTVRFYGSED